MVKIGFICEGYTELFILKSDDFNALLSELGLECVGVINVEGNGNLLPKNIEKHRKNLIADGAEKIMILTDLDEDLCITLTKQRIGEQPDQHIIIAVKQIESWFLADTSTMKSIFRGNFLFENPEDERVPIETIRRLYFDKFNKGLIGRDEKKKLAFKMVENGFSLKSVAAHPNCPSASYFLKKLQEIKN